MAVVTQNSQHTSSPPLLLPTTDYRADVPEVMLLPQKRLCIALGPRNEIEECSFAPAARPTGGFRADYGFFGTLDAKIRCDPDREIGYRITDDTNEIYGRLDDAQDNRSLMSGQFNLPCRDRRSHARMSRLMKSGSRASHEAWVQSMDASDMTCSKKMPPRKAPKTRTTPTTTTTTTTPMTDEQLKAIIAQGVADVLAEHGVTRRRNEFLS
ncbi:hypothetical protein Tco_0909919 [Tanacetum coccineum]|uniref:Uncharacterized protein n=1 Tax=Tanacetum coccineum TaxID=301880 RepID=A0ABQ5CSC9_9ASTR